jgi:hypothetical protein
MAKVERPRIIKFGRYSSHFDRVGVMVNVPLLTVMSKQAVQEYIGYLQKLLPYCRDEEGKKAK